MSAIKPKRTMGERALRRKRRHPTVVLGIGDRDDWGEKIYVNAAEDAIGWARDDGYMHPAGASLCDLLAAIGKLPTLTFFRLVFSPEQAGPLGVLDQTRKAEADAIPVTVLDGWLREAIEHLQDSACRAEFEREQEVERERIPNVVRTAFDAAA